MNVCARNTFVSLWLFFGVLSLSAQGACFYFPFINNASPGSSKLMPLKVINLDSAVAVQLVVRWDPAVLQYTNIDNLMLGDLSFADFNTARALDSGYVRMQWEGATSLPPGTSVPDSSTIFRMRFKVIGPDTSSTPVKITELLTFPPLNFEVIKVQADTSNVAYGLSDCLPSNGFVAVGYTVSAEEPEALEIPLSISPNPFLVSAQLDFFLTETAEVQAFISDAMGRIVFEKNFFSLPPGQHGMVIENEMLGAPGVYALTLRAGRKIATQKFVLF